MITPDVFIFFVISGVIILVVFAILFIIVRFLVKLAIALFKKIFYKKNPNKDHGADLGITVEELEESKEERAKLEKQKATSAAMPAPKLSYKNYSQASPKNEPKKRDEQTYEEKEKKDIAEGLSKLKSSSPDEEEKETLESKMPLRTENQEADEHQEIKIPRAKVMGGDSIKNFDAEEKKEPLKDQQQTYEEKEKKDIAEGLSKLKSSSPDEEEKETLESKMPSRPSGYLERQGENNFKEIKIPTSSDLHSQGLVYEKKEIEAAKKTFQGQNKGLIDNASSGTSKVYPKQQAKQDDSIFGGKEEISRINLRWKLRKDPKIWKAQRDLRMNLSPIERVKMEKETFAPVYGRNISKKDLKLNLKRLGREWVSTTDMKRKEVLRKEIKFFKKIGGIK